MKIVVLFGSPNKNGNTQKLLDKYLNSLENNNAFIEVIYVNDLNICACIGCDACKDKLFCPLDDWDKVSLIYEKIKDANMLIIAAPIYFASFPSQLKALIDRFQPLYYKRFLRNEKDDKIKTGTALFCGGGKERAHTRLVLEKQVKMVFDVLGVKMKDFIIQMQTDGK